MAQFVDLLGEWLVGKDGLAKTTDLVANKKAIGLYFSAGWCPPCKVFTPKLVEKYETKLEAKGMEIVLVPTDSNEYETEVDHKSMPWLALPYKDWKKGIRLSRKYVIPGVPCLVILDCNGKLVTNDGKYLNDASLCFRVLFNYFCSYFYILTANCLKLRKGLLLISY